MGQAILESENIGMKKLCECGCGKPVTRNKNYPHNFNRFIHGHSSIMKPSEETKRKMSKAHKGITTWNKGIPLSKEHRRNISLGNTGKIRSKGMRKKYSKSKKGITKEINPNLVCSEMTRRKMSKTGLRRWQNHEYKERQLKAIFAGYDIRPTKPEKRLNRLLQRLFSGEYKYVGDGKIWIAGKNPDFINVNNQKKIIELFGSYWHSKKITGMSKKENRIQRQNHFAKYGYKSLIIWESELKNIKRLERKLVVFYAH